MVAWILCLVFVAGCVGGLVNSLLAGELQLPKTDKSANVYRPGWLGNVVIGGVAALVFWGLYGPLAESAVIGGEASQSAASLKIGELFGSLITGIGGGRLLTAEIDRHALKNQNNALEQTKISLADAIGKLVEQKEEP